MEENVHRGAHASLGGAISIPFGSQVSFATVGEVRYSSQNFCDKTMDDKMALYRECCFPNCIKLW